MRSPASPYSLGRSVGFLDQSAYRYTVLVVGREIVWRSPILFTPFLTDGTIDARALGEFITHSYRDAGFTQKEIDSGAVILTGEAIKRKNARAIEVLINRNLAFVV